MKRSYMKQIKPCFGTDNFMQIKECYLDCPFKQKCLLVFHGKYKEDIKEWNE